MLIQQEQYNVKCSRGQFIVNLTSAPTNTSCKKRVKKTRTAHHVKTASVRDVTLKQEDYIMLKQEDYITLKQEDYIT